MAEQQGTARGYSASQISEFKERLQELRNETAAVQMVLFELTSHLTIARAKTFANEGIGRRLPLIARSAMNIFKIFPPDAQSLLSRDSCDDISIQLQAFAINVYALFDNMAWVCMLEAGGSLSPLKVSLFKKDIEPFLPDELKTYAAKESMKKWFDEYGKVYRDSTAHRIPPYLPSRAYTAEEGRQYQELHERANAALVEASKVMPTDRKRGHELLDQQEALLRSKEMIGSNSLLIALSLSSTDGGPPIYMHPQLLCDWALANEAVRTFDRAMRAQYGWPARELPNVYVS